MISTSLLNNANARWVRSVTRSNRKLISTRATMTWATMVRCAMEKAHDDLPVRFLLNQVDRADRGWRAGRRTEKEESAHQNDARLTGGIRNYQFGCLYFHSARSTDGTDTKRRTDERKTAPHIFFAHRPTVPADRSSS